jgi:CRP/FNR family transcriptional regulator, cyclic AMP receptor protein
VTKAVDESVIRSAPLFSALSEEEATSLRSSMTLVKVTKGHTLFKEGEEGDRLYVVLDGKLKLGKSSPDGRENLQEILGPGEMFGELSLFDPGPRTATATAITDAKLLMLPHEKVLDLITAQPAVSLELLRRLAQRLRDSRGEQSDLVFVDVPGRVAKAIIDLGERFGDQREDGLYVKHDLTQEELAQLVGASRETVNKALADFAARGWVALEPRAVLVKDYERISKRGK